MGLESECPLKGKELVSPNLMGRVGSGTWLVGEVVLIMSRREDGFALPA